MNSSLATHPIIFVSIRDHGIYSLNSWFDISAFESVASHHLFGCSCRNPWRKCAEYGTSTIRSFWSIEINHWNSGGLVRWLSFSHMSIPLPSPSQLAAWHWSAQFTETMFKTTYVHKPWRKKGVWDRSKGKSALQQAACLASTQRSTTQLTPHVQRSKKAWDR
jgi:hypothetical protein